MLLLSVAECHDPWFPYSSNLPPPLALHLSTPGEGSHFTISRKSIEGRPPSSIFSLFFSPFFFFVVPQRGQSHNDKAPFSDASLPKKYFPPSSSPPRIIHFLKKTPFPLVAFFPHHQHLLIRNGYGDIPPILLNSC